MDINTLYGLLTLLLLVLFIGIVLWAYSGRRKKDFEEAARLPLEDEPTDSSDTDHRENKK